MEISLFHISSEHAIGEGHIVRVQGHLLCLVFLVDYLKSKEIGVSGFGTGQDDSSRVSRKISHSQVVHARQPCQ